MNIFIVCKVYDGVESVNVAAFTDKTNAEAFAKKFAHQESELNLDEWYVVEEIPLRGEIKW